MFTFQIRGACQKFRMDHHLIGLASDTLSLHLLQRYGERLLLCFNYNTTNH